MNADTLANAGAGIKEVAGGLLNVAEVGKPSGDLLIANKLGFQIGTVRDGLNTPDDAASAVQTIASVPLVSKPPSLDTAHKPGEPSLGQNAPDLANERGHVVPQAQDAGDWRKNQQEPGAAKPADAPPVVDTARKLTTDQQTRLNELKQKSPDGKELPIAERVEMAKLQEAEAEVVAATNADETTARKLFKDVDSGAMQLTALTPEQIALMEKFEPQFKAEQTVVALENANGETVVSVSAAQKMGEIANRRAQLQTNLEDVTRPGVDTLARPPEAQMARGVAGELGVDEQGVYDKYVKDIEGKLDGGRKLTEVEAQDYQAHLDRQESQANAGIHAETVELGAQINRELADPNNKGEMTPATKDRFVQFVDNLTGGAYSKNNLFAEALGLNLLDSAGKARIAEKLQQLSKRMTPEIAARINERLQLLAQLEVQVYSLRAQRDENALSAREVKNFIREHYGDYNPQDDDDLTEDKAMVKRQKWLQSLSTLNSYKAAIGAAEMSHVILLQEAGQVRADINKELGVNKGEGIIGGVVRKLGNFAERRTTDALIKDQYDEIEDKVNISSAAIANHKPLDLSSLKP